MKTLMNIFVALAFFCMSAVFVNAQTIVRQGTCGDKLEWVLTDESTLIISGTGKMYDYNLNTKQAPWSGTFQKDIRNIVIENGVTSIGNYAFYNCPDLTSVRFSDDLLSIGDYAFSYCISLEGALDHLPLSVNNIGTCAFNSCGFTSVTVPENVKTLGGAVFRKCPYKILNFNAINCTSDAFPFASDTLSTINFGNKVQIISDRIFSSCKGLASVELPISLIAIGEGAFYDCDFTSITIPEGVKTIGKSAFHGCLKLKTVEISSTVTDIKDLAFYAAYDLTSITSHAITPPSLGDRVFTSGVNTPVHIPPCSYFSYCADLEGWGIFNNFFVNGNPVYYSEQEICMISVDTEYHNEVVWKKRDELSAYNIYREGYIAGQFEWVATVDSDSPNKWVDMESNARVRSYRYKVAGIDDCDNVSQLSSPHKTMHLTISQGIGGSWNLIWTPYEGIKYSTYRLYRATGETLGELELIATMSSSNTSYTDFVVSDTYVYYVVEIVSVDACEVSAQKSSPQYANSDIPFGAIRSNFVTNNPKGIITGLETINSENSILIYPNPVINELSIESGEMRINKLAIVDLLGRTIYKHNNPSAKINVSNLLSGVYFVFIETDEGFVTKKIVKK